MHWIVFYVTVVLAKESFAKNMFHYALCMNIFADSVAYWNQV